MNRYLSREEKETFVRLTSLAGLAESIIKKYESASNPDKQFLKSLRTANTWLIKALDYRTSFLDEKARIDLAKQVSKLELIFVPNDKARKEYEIVKEMQNTLHMPLSDFQDWYCEVIEHTCKTCSRKDYHKCKMRAILQKYGIYPVDPGADKSCQFSYVAPPNEVK